MKKLSLFFLISVISIFTVISRNNQKTYYASDDIVVRIDRLCMETGVLGPTPVSPITEKEIKNSLQRINVSQLSKREKAEYYSILSLLEEDNGYSSFDNIVLDPVIQMSPEIYLFNNTKETLREEFFIPFRDRSHFLDLGIQASFNDGAYLEFNFPYMDGVKGFDIDGEGNTVSGQYFYNFSNFSFLISPSYNGKWENMFYKDPSIHDDHYILEYIPVKIITSIGTDYCNFLIGRMRQSFGNGITGNMILGDTLTYQETMRLSFFSEIFSYYMSLTHYDNAENKQSSSFDGLHQQKSVHRFDFNILNKFRIAINLGTHFTTNSAFDWRMMMPLMINHNRFNFSESEYITNGDEANNIMGLELEWAIYKGWRLGMEFALDQYQLSIETGSNVTNAYGFLINAKNTTGIEKGSFYSFIEFVYTNPYLYLNHKKNIDDSFNYCYDHIAGYSYWSQNELNYIGHEFGPDAIGFSVGSSFIAVEDKWNIGLTTTYIIHGEKGKEAYRSKVSERNGNAKTPTGTAEYTLRFDLESGYRINRNLSIQGKAAAIFNKNYKNQENAFKKRIQCSIGLKWTII